MRINTAIAVLPPIIKWRKDGEMKIVGIVALFDPKVEDINNICEYLTFLDSCILMDDSQTCNQEMVMEYINRKGLVSKYIYIWNRDNIGLCKSMNVGIQIASTQNADWILLMDQDSQWATNLVYEYKQYVENHDTDKICSLVPQYNYDRHQRCVSKKIKEVTWSNMSGTCINCKWINKIGLFDERFFIDGLDVEWCIRARKKGFHILEIGSAVLNHHPAKTKTIKIGNRIIYRYGYDTPERYYYQFRSFWCMIKETKNIIAIKWMLIKVMKVILLFDNKLEYLKMFKKAIQDVNHERWGKKG